MHFFSGQVCHITIQTDGKIPFVEGQSYGIIPPVSSPWILCSAHAPAPVPAPISQAGQRGAPPSCAAHAAQGTKINAKGKEVQHATRLYTIASTRYGDGFDGQTVSGLVLP